MWTWPVEHGAAIHAASLAVISNSLSFELRRLEPTRSWKVDRIASMEALLCETWEGERAPLMITNPNESKRYFISFSFFLSPIFGRPTWPNLSVLVLSILVVGWID